MALLPTSKVFDGGAMALQLGGELANLEVAYETYGTLTNDAANAVLICHGYTSNPNAGDCLSCVAICLALPTAAVGRRA